MVDADKNVPFANRPTRFNSINPPLTTETD